MLHLGRVGIVLNPSSELDVPKDHFSFIFFASRTLQDQHSLANTFYGSRRRFNCFVQLR